MNRLLYIQASPNDEESYSVRTANCFVNEYLRLHPQMKLETINVCHIRLPEYDKAAVAGRLAARKEDLRDPAEVAAWKEIERTCKEFINNTIYAFAVPMWNFCIPYQLKQYIDNIFQPGLTFGIDPEKGITGMMTGRKAFVAYSRGSEYLGSPAENMDFQTRYFDFILECLGFEQVEKVIVEPCRAKGREVAALALEKACESAVRVARIF